MTIIVVEAVPAFAPGLLCALREQGLDAILSTNTKVGTACGLRIFLCARLDPEVLQWCQAIREVDWAGTLFVLIEHLQVEDTVAVLGAGADGVAAQSIHPNELVARARALLRRMQSVAPISHVARTETLRGEETSGTAFLGDQRLELTKRELTLLRHFLGHRGETITRERLLLRFGTRRAIRGRTSLRCTCETCERSWGRPRRGS